MKTTNLLLIVAMALTVMACGESKSPSDELVPDTPNSGTPAPPTQEPNATVNTVPGAVGQVAHYICPNNCANSGAAQAGSCAVCGAELLHNQSYHDQQGSATTTNPTINTTPQIQQQPSPAQNAAGEYHYTCGNGCAGGAGTAGVCASCGGQLVHNAAYHN